MPFGLAMEIRLRATAAAAMPFPLPALRNHARPCSFTGALSHSQPKPVAFHARTGAIRSPNSKEVPRAHGAKMSVAVPESLLIKRTAVEVVDDLRGTSLFLVGMNCTMKTDLGKILADSLRYYYFDSDSLIQQAAGGTSAAKTFREEDEKGFQSAETEVLKQLSAMGRLVVCAGDGAVQSATNLSYLRYGVSIWVDVPLDYLANEFMVSEASSSIMSTTQETDPFTKVMNVLLQQYNKLKEGFAIADTTVSLLKVASQLGHEDLTSVTAEDMALETLKGIQKLTRVKKMMEEAGRPF
ncbi:probable inactive shikimate kinase like 1, chloroplastic [Zingiber officinale]|uniref:probable inactive shikimate kinase like 1, chloroplastic n=1 Tax=Zingiber officinale TaxID=94328 RepID=UPI001C4C4C5F|nr:probable inactive shikimate kinase like 1, chloroplastic [Zingiber officinale]